MSLLQNKEYHVFEGPTDLETLLVFMAGCAIRERGGLIKRNQRVGSSASVAVVGYDQENVRDFCRVIALCESKTPEEYEGKLAHLIENVHNF